MSALRVWTVNLVTPYAPCQLRSLRSPAVGRGGVAVSASSDVSSHERDSADLATFGYKQELRRSLGTFSSFAVAFSYISPSTGIFTLFALGLTTLGGVFIWTWPVVALGQFIIALNFAEVSSHFPLAGSVFQWTKYLANRSLLLVHRLDLPVRRHHHRQRGRGHPATRADPGAQRARLEEPERDQPEYSGSRRAHHARRHHRPEYLRCAPGGDHQQHRRAVRDPRHVRVRADPAGLP